MRYEIRGLAADGTLVRLELEAPDACEAGEQAAARGVTVLTLRRGTALASLAPRRRARFPLLMFSEELLALLQAGIGLVESVETLAEKQPRPETRRELLALAQRLRNGEALSAALQQSPQAFPSLYVAAVRAAERSGDLPEALARYVAYEWQIEQLRAKLAAAAVYPALLSGLGLLVTLFLLAFVVPRFGHIYEDLGGELHWLSKGLLVLGLTLERYAIEIALAAGLTLAFGARWLGRAEARAWLLRLAWRIPALGEPLRTYHLARFYRTLGMLLRGGTAMVPALGMAQGMLPATLRPSLEAATRGVREGRAVSETLLAAGLATPVALRMLRVGERSGRMGEMLERIAQFHDVELARRADWLTRLFEPLLMAGIGLVIGFIVLLLYLPIFELAGSIE